MSSTPTSNGPLPLPDLLSTTAAALDAVARLAEAAERGVAALVAPDGRVDAAALDRHQVAAHGFAWVATYAEALRQMQGWAERLDRAGRLGELEACMLQAAFGEYLAQLDGGLAMSQGEIVRPADFGLDEAERAAFRTEAVRRLIAAGNASALRLRIAELLADALHGGGFGEAALEDEALDMVREQFRRFVADVVEPHAHEWHLKDELIPMPVVEQMAEMGVFGLTVPEEDGGLGMGKLAMCVVTEELSRGYIGVGSLGTRAEIAAELIRLGGTAEQRARWLPRLASGEILPTAVFTEPNTGSDLGSLRTRAVLEGDTYRVTGAKTWITHGSRSDLMTLLVRTDPDAPGYRGLSMLLAEKPRGTEADPFPAEGMSGGEIPVLGYRGMKEYEIGFDGFAVPRENLLGGVEGQGFKQLMATFESARVQTAARAVGVAQNAMELGLRYAQERVQFGRPLAAFPRVAGKIAWMAVETMIARQLTYFAAREKDSDRRCDIEAGMAKLLAARVAWSNADNAVQIHGGNGYAVEYPISRVLCDARILNIFEGAAEIQAQVVARGLLTRRN
ncbi:acyl-CoA dehydrogenase [Azospirillum brasilense]|uniref:Acyl-CoA dehydrogenase n=1 Tax=Azospirillum brasilense TaxID=192 RepID=A0A0P0ESC9_AZOBR|nr:MULTISPECIES: acyl-CoA dehydrogenase family protein [Azospirillum]ALJ38962.1 acyl-CoA dehydrogenase [Azospirillum brasilense]MDW7557826.1 acyl-CoA dehydrogenase family protein [Azospirillum brasilense]MDW7596338.1 acyl-CoA dehydrogenase family protein [Azospirillum brasilense]MDW7631795.1 acyl-CoA dehydrogenase family protein [Azospirillum brasilense]MDX5950635.1 acyl-CoA dehydrogenase family protein [Azospirillum brasilense]